MMRHADDDRRGRLIPTSGSEDWRVALAEKPGGFEYSTLLNGDGKTQYLLVTGPGTVFDKNNPQSGTKNFIDRSGRSKSTIPLIIHVDPSQAITFTSVQEFYFDPGMRNPLQGSTPEFRCLMADGSVKTFSKNIDPATLRMLFQVYPEISDSELRGIIPELRRYGLPTSVPKPPGKFKKLFDK